MNLLRTTLDNGLKVLIRESHAAPVVSVWAWYRAGVRNEHLGVTGISHWVEHMAFKGSARWPEGSADQAIAREGGVFNGMTWYDFTTYYETLPAHKISLALDIESDRMHNIVFEPEAVESERTVIISERQGNENSPLFLLGEEVAAAAYRVHPYGHETLGHLCDLQTMTRDTLYHYYQRYYTPSNAILAIAGDFNTGEIERLAERYFGSIATGPQVPPVGAIEPPQRGERRVIVEGAGQTDYLNVAFHIPEARHEDFFALTVLNAVLGGAAGFLVGGGAVTNHTSRLYRALVDKEFAIDVGGSLMSTVDPGLYQLTATAWPGRALADVETALWTEIERLQTSPVTPPELEKAQRQARALFAYASESATQQAFWLGYSEIFADYGWFTRYLDKLAAVTADDVQRAAQIYLRPQNRTTGWYLSKK
ncbi:MAG TPA: pitrilysin family protein [Anaerolineae bacterium]|nr:pitrilysin family protein [Anaerolineae bacterium]HQH38252.1 pitrilysin family protein [Anaerolineae bacterium]